MAEIRDWKEMTERWARLLKERTGEGVEAWNRRIETARLKDEKSLRAWLARQGVSGYARTLLVMERFGYPDFFVASASELIDGQYADRPRLRPILDAVIEAAAKLDEVAVQARKTFVALVTPRRTFARVQPTTRTRIDLALRLEGHRPGGRLQASKLHETMPLHVSLGAPGDVDAEVRGWLRQAYDQSSRQGRRGSGRPRPRATRDARRASP
jgi:hypothetical protein